MVVHKKHRWNHKRHSLPSRKQTRTLENIGEYLLTFWNVNVNLIDKFRYWYLLVQCERFKCDIFIIIEVVNAIIGENVNLSPGWGLTSPKTTLAAMWHNDIQQQQALLSIKIKLALNKMRRHFCTPLHPPKNLLKN